MRTSLNGANLAKGTRGRIESWSKRPIENVMDINQRKNVMLGFYTRPTIPFKIECEKSNIK